MLERPRHLFLNPFINYYSFSLSLHFRFSISLSFSYFSLCERQTHQWKVDNFWGLVVGNLTTGIGMGWWKRSHNVHHVCCNSIEHDPDIQHM